MTHPPFDLIWDGGLTVDDVPTHTDLMNLDERVVSLGNYHAQFADKSARLALGALAHAREPASVKADPACLAWDSYNGALLIIDRAESNKTIEYIWGAGDAIGRDVDAPVANGGTPAITCNNLGHVLVSSGHPTGSTARLAFTNDTGANYTAVALPNRIERPIVVFNGTLFVISDNAGAKVYTYDGTSLVDVTTGAGIGASPVRLSANPTTGRIVAVFGSNIVRYSDNNGATWTTVTLAVGLVLNDVAWDETRGRFVAVGNIFGGYEVLWTADGVTWSDTFDVKSYSLGPLAPLLVTPQNALRVVVNRVGLLLIHATSATAMGQINWYLASHDGGGTWQPIASGNIARFPLDMCGTDSGFAIITDNDKKLKIYG